MSDDKFGKGPPKNGNQVNITFGHPAPTPYHVEVWVNGALSHTRKCGSKAEAEQAQREESVS